MTRLVWVAAALLLLGLVSARPIWRMIEAAGLLAELSGYHRSSIDIERREISYTIDGRRRVADLYGKTGASLILAPGAAVAGKDEPRLAALARSLARFGWRVLVPDIAGARALKVSSADSVDIADAIRHVTSDGHRTAIAVVSYAAVPAILAALEPDIADRIEGIAAIGPPYDSQRLITFFTTGFWRKDAEQPWQRLAPNAYGKWVFILSNIDRVEDSGDRALLAAIARRNLADAAAPIDDLLHRLGPQGGSVMALLNNERPDRVPELMRALPPGIQDAILDLDLARHDLKRLKSELLILHGRNDRIIPVGEGIALAAAVDHSRLYLLDNLAHADLTSVSPVDAWALWRAMYRLLEWRDHMG